MDWEKLDEATHDYDREPFRNLADIVAVVDYCIVKDEESNRITAMWSRAIFCLIMARIRCFLAFCFALVHSHVGWRVHRLHLQLLFRR